LSSRDFCSVIEVDDTTGIFPNVGQASDFLKLYCETCHYLCSVPEKGKHPDTFVVEKIMDDVLYSEIFYCFLSPY
jgi:hypothetical protein